MLPALGSFKHNIHGLKREYHGVSIAQALTLRLRSAALSPARKEELNLGCGAPRRRVLSAKVPRDQGENVVGKDLPSISAFCILAYFCTFLLSIFGLFIIWVLNHRPRFRYGTMARGVLVFRGHGGWRRHWQRETSGEDHLVAYPLLSIQKEDVNSYSLRVITLMHFVTDGLM